PSIKYLGYVERQGGSSLAVVDDGDEGVRLVQEGDMLGDRFRVVKVQPGLVDVVEFRSGLTTPVGMQPLASIDPRHGAHGGDNLVPRLDLRGSVRQSSVERLAEPHSIGGPVPLVSAP